MLVMPTKINNLGPSKAKSQISLPRLRRPHSGARHSESDPVLIQVLKDNLKDNLESLEGTATVTVMKFGDPQITEGQICHWI